MTRELAGSRKPQPTKTAGEKEPPLSSRTDPTVATSRAGNGEASRRLRYESERYCACGHVPVLAIRAS